MAAAVINPISLNPIPTINFAKAIHALLEYLKSSNSKLEKSKLFEADDLIYLLLTLNRMPTEDRTNPHRIPIPKPLHPFVSGSTSICIILDDSSNSSLLPESAREKIKASNLPIDHVVGLWELKSDYKPYESRRKLCHSYDLFFADRKILPMLPRFLGKQFFKSKKLPLAVDFSRVGWAEQIKAWCESSLMYMGAGTCSALKIGRLGMSEEDIFENALAVIEKAVDYVPKKWGGLRSVHVKTVYSAALPIYQVVPDVGLKIEGVWDEEKKKMLVERKKKRESDGEGKKERKVKKGRIGDVNCLVEAIGDEIGKEHIGDEIGKEHIDDEVGIENVDGDEKVEKENSKTSGKVEKGMKSKISAKKADGLKKEVSKKKSKKGRIGDVNCLVVAIGDEIGKEHIDDEVGIENVDGDKKVEKENGKTSGKVEKGRKRRISAKKADGLEKEVSKKKNKKGIKGDKIDADASEMSKKRRGFKDNKADTEASDEKVEKENGETSGKVEKGKKWKISAKKADDLEKEVLKNKNKKGIKGDKIDADASEMSKKRRGFKDNKADTEASELSKKKQNKGEKTKKIGIEDCEMSKKRKQNKGERAEFEANETSKKKKANKDDKAETEADTSKKQLKGKKAKDCDIVTLKKGKSKKGDEAIDNARAEENVEDEPKEVVRSDLVGKKKKTQKDGGVAASVGEKLKGQKKDVCSDLVGKQKKKTQKGGGVSKKGESKKSE